MTKKNSASLQAISVLGMISVMATAVPTIVGAVPQDERMYAYCRATEFDSSGGRVWVSNVFAVDSEVDHGVIANSFQGHLEDVHGARVSTPKCADYHDTRQDAFDSWQDDLLGYRAIRLPVHTVSWSYRGD